LYISLGGVVASQLERTAELWTLDFILGYTAAITPPAPVLYSRCVVAIGGVSIVDT
jgi:hypothetical protein